ncbi:MAG: hypothetical protein WD058_09425 [Dehalococcoidia bacterium]
MTHVSRRRLLQLGGMAAAATAGSLILPRPSAATAIAPREAVRVVGDPAPGVYRALDTDFGAGAVPSQAWFDAARAAGYDGLVTTLHTHWGGEARPWLAAHVALERALGAGMWTAAYGRPVSRWREALSHVPRDLRERLRFFGLDVGVEPRGRHEMRHEYVDGVTGEFGVRPVIYTGWGMWGDVMGYDNAEFAHVPLWEYADDRFDWPDAVIDGDAVPFGGWNVDGNPRVGWQVQMQRPTLLGGVPVARNVFSRAFIDG